MADKGHLIIISGPSGVGKGTVCDRLLKQRKSIVKSVSVTTRKPRIGEVDGVDYFFKSKRQYDELKEKGGFLETFSIYDNYYGTPAEFVEKNINSGKSVLLEIDVQGALAVKQKMPESKLIFLAPPSIEHLVQRLCKRNTEDEQSFNKRICAARTELDNKDKYDYIIINDDIDKATEEIKRIIDDITK
ncbi:MAG: guanylate kinase [Clostridia bacterium]|nr:guanylate kinase [Clostridia bacterium]